MYEGKKKALAVKFFGENQQKALKKAKYSRLLSSIITKIGGKHKMKRNLIILGLLIGGIFGLLPLLAKLTIFTGLALYLYMAYDEHAYQVRNGGRE